MENNGVTPRTVVQSLISSDINRFKNRVVSLIDKFYDEYDSRKSLNQYKLLEILSRVHIELDCIISELEA